jgi:hypothetical protein
MYPLPILQLLQDILSVYEAENFVDVFLEHFILLLLNEDLELNHGFHGQKVGVHSLGQEKDIAVEVNGEMVELYFEKCH